MPKVESGEPLVSIVVPAFNSAQFLPECLASLVGQTYRNLEIIVVDDGSADSTRTILEEWSRRDERIKAIHQANAGVSCARRAGFEAAKADLICFVDSDDVAHPRMIQELVSGKRKLGVQVMCAQYGSIGSDDREKGSPYNRKTLTRTEAVSELLYQRVANGPVAKLYDKDVLCVGDFQPKMTIGEDLIMNLRAFMRLSSVGVTASRLYGYRVHSGGASKNASIQSRVNLIHELTQIRPHAPTKAFSSRIFAEALYASFDREFYGSDRSSGHAELGDILKRYRWPVIYDPQASNALKVYALCTLINRRLPRILHAIKNERR